MRCCAAPSQTTGIDRSAPSVVSLTSSWRGSYSIRPANNSTTVGEYIANAQQNLQGYDLPMGAKLEPVNIRSGDWLLQLPALQFLDVHIRCATNSIRTEPCSRRCPPTAKPGWVRASVPVVRRRLLLRIPREMCPHRGMCVTRVWAWSWRWQKVSIDLPSCADLVHLPSGDCQVSRHEHNSNQACTCRPCAAVKMITQPGRLDVTSTEVTIDGSQRVNDLDLASRYDIDVSVAVVEQTSTQFEISADLNLFVDVPPPFNFTPKGVTEAGGNAVVGGLLASLMPAFAQIMVQDMEGRYQRRV